MTAFEQYLFSIGYKPFKKCFEKKEWVYFPLEENELSAFSTSVTGRIDNRWVRENNFDNEIIFGLHEKNKPPTLAYPRPKGIYTDDQMNILLKNNSPEEIYKMIYP